VCAASPKCLQTKNPTNVGLDVVERVNLFKQEHFFDLQLYGEFKWSMITGLDFALISERINEF